MAFSFLNFGLKYSNVLFKIKAMITPTTDEIIAIKTEKTEIEYATEMPFCNNIDILIPDGIIL